MHAGEKRALGAQDEYPVVTIFRVRNTIFHICVASETPIKQSPETLSRLPSCSSPSNDTPPNPRMTPEALEQTQQKGQTASKTSKHSIKQPLKTINKHLDTYNNLVIPSIS